MKWQSASSIIIYPDFLIAYSTALKTVMEGDLDRKVTDIFTFLIIWNQVWYMKDHLEQVEFKNLERHFSKLLEVVSSTDVVIELSAYRELLNIDLND